MILPERTLALYVDEKSRTQAPNRAASAARCKCVRLNNEDLGPFRWTGTAGKILADLACFRKRTLETGHRLEV